MIVQVCQPEGNYYDKYSSRNPIVRKLMKNFFNVMDEMLKISEIGTSAWGGWCLEAGCGEGNVTDHVFNWITNAGAEVKFSAFDISSKLIEENARKYPSVKFFVHNIYEPIDKGMLSDRGKFDMIMCCEVLEHMADPEKAVKNLMQYGDRFLFSVPHEPIWRIMNIARGKYLKNLGNTPGHIQHFSVKAFVLMLEKCGLKVLELRRPIPWIMVYCEKESFRRGF